MATSTTSTTKFSQLTCFTSINRNFNFQQRRSIHFMSIRPKLSVAMSLERHDAETSSASNNPKLSYQAVPSSSAEVSEEKAYAGDVNGKLGGNGPINPVIAEKKTAKIHDFCFGIPFGGFVLTGGILGSISSKNLSTLGTGVLFGGAVLALSTISLKVWREGKSCYPFIIGQAVLAATLLWKNFQTYSTTKKLFPSGLYALVSAAMLCFYSYVVISGGNPPPKKTKSTAEAAL
ncbi:hypothetical protein RND81_14G038900 [Saponaria officinalis]|uniref:Protein FATTY ACID EXPORT 1, chloroplastic n=1 Tax=Saponaria officinalis TaxID=3572 RepID=A0AAW1GKT2_SAPOF